MLIRETWVNQSKGYQCGDSGLYEPFTDVICKLYLALQKEHGRCVSSMYIDNPDGSSKRIGWVFEKKMKYEDCKEYYIQETWVELHEQKPDVVTTNHYIDLEV